MNLKSNIFISILREFHIPHTMKFAINSYDQHPYKFTFYGLKSLCEYYGIEVEGLYLEDKNEIKNLSVPFVADYLNDYVLVKKVSDVQIKIEIYGTMLSITYDEFIEGWGGHVLLFHPNKKSCEPNYKEHKNSILLSKLEYGGLILCSIILLISKMFLRPNFHFWEIVLIISSAFGAFLSTMLLLQQLDIHNAFIAKLCTALKNSSCHNVLETKAAKIFGRYSWAEIGFSYFVTNFIFLLISSNYNLILAYIAGLILPYSIWSIGYQKYISQWCPLCLMVQGVIVFQFFLYLIVGCYRSIFELHLWLALTLIAVYVIIGVIIHIYMNLLSESNELLQVKFQYNNLKTNPQIFQFLLSQEEEYPPSSSSIIFGNLNADLRITIFSNPYCNPCALMHRRLHKIFDAKSCQIEYVFTSFRPEWNIINKYLIAVYKKYGSQKAWEIYSEWYDKGKFKQERFFDKYSLNIENEDVKKEFDSHEAWREKTRINTTPTILVNNHKMPYGYVIEDLQNIL